MKCFYHNDMDGHCAGWVVSKHYILGQDYQKSDFIESDYSNLDLSSVQFGELVVFVDYSFTESTLHNLKYLIEELNCDVIWIDHHDSSIKLCEKYRELRDIAGIRSKEYSGAALAYMYFNCIDDYPLIPRFIKLVSDYDTWQHVLRWSDEFKLGLDCFPNDVFDPIWDKLNDDKHIQFTTPMTQELIDRGRIIRSYIDQDNENYLECYGYESQLNTGDIVLVVNKKTNSWIFGDNIDRYVAVIVYVFDGSCYSYTIYSSDPTFNCAEYAEQYGGGGHKGAAGWRSKELLFKSIE